MSEQNCGNCRFYYYENYIDTELGQCTWHMHHLPSPFWTRMNTHESSGTECPCYESDENPPNKD